MMHTYSAEILKLSTIHELEDAWSSADYKELLEACEFDSIDEVPEGELMDYLSMALQELDPETAAEIVLLYRLGDKLKKGQIESISHEMLEENLWEEYSDMSLHEELFNITSLLFKALNGKFPNPDAADLLLKISSKTVDGTKSLESIDESLIARVLALGQDDHAIINRLFDEQVAGALFHEAKDIIWKYKITERERNNVTIQVTTAIYWVKKLRKGNLFEVNTLNDPL